MEEFNELIREIANELNLRITFLADNWLTILENDSKIQYIQGYKFNINGHGIGNILDDKGLFYELLISKNLPIIEHKVLFFNYDKNDVLKYFYKNNHELIIKGNIGTCGKEVFLVKKEEDLFLTIDRLFQNQFSISLCPYYDILHEYRLIVLNNVIRIIYGKKRPFIIGDGQRTIQELLEEFNPDFYKKMENHKEEYKRIPKDKEEVLVNYQFNLSNGAIIFEDIPEDLREKLSNLALLVAEKLSISFGSIDIIETTDHNLLVMEANSGVMMNNYIHLKKEGRKIAKEIYKDAIKKMFEE